MNTVFKLTRTLHGTKILQSITALTLALGLSTTAHAATLTLSASTQTISAGSNVSVVLGISGLSSLPLGAYDLTIQSSDPVWNFIGGTFGSGLGVTPLQSMGLNSSGLLELTQVSLDSPATLSANQPGAFTLATLNFIISSSIAGLSSTSLYTSNVTLSDAYGNSLTVDSSSPTFQVTNTPPSAVPLPAAWLLFAAGLAAMEGSRRWTLKSQKA